MSVAEVIECGRRAVAVVVDWSKTVGPVPFFIAMALLPAVGFPITVFSLTAGALFVPQIGLGWTLVGALLALGSNMALTYWMARYALRPLLGGIVRKLGYGLPEVLSENHLGMTLLFRIMPGPPFFAQNYILGLAEIRFWTYLWVSWLIQGVFAVAMVVFTDRLMQGSGKVIFLSVSVFIAVMIAIKMVVRRIRHKKAEAA